MGNREKYKFLKQKRVQRLLTKSAPKEDSSTLRSAGCRNRNVAYSSVKNH